MDGAGFELVILDIRFRTIVPGSQVVLPSVALSEGDDQVPRICSSAIAVPPR